MWASALNICEKLKYDNFGGRDSINVFCPSLSSHKSAHFFILTYDNGSLNAEHLRKVTEEFWKDISSLLINPSVPHRKASCTCRTQSKMISSVEHLYKLTEQKLQIYAVCVGTSLALCSSHYAIRKHHTSIYKEHNTNFTTNVIQG